MIGKKEVGDDVLVLGNVAEVDYISYVDKYDFPNDNMDNLIGNVEHIVEVYDDPGRPLYKISNSRWWWAPEWLSDVYDDQLPGQLSIEDFGLVVS